MDFSNACFSTTQDGTFRVRGLVGHVCFPGPLEVLESHSQLRHTNSSKPMRLGLMVSPLTLQSNFDCCAAAHGYLPGGLYHGISCYRDTTTPNPFKCFPVRTICLLADFRLGHSARTLCCVLSADHGLVDIVSCTTSLRTRRPSRKPLICRRPGSRSVLVWSSILLILFLPCAHPPRPWTFLVNPAWINRTLNAPRHLVYRGIPPKLVCKISPP